MLCCAVLSAVLVLCRARQCWEHRRRGRAGQGGARGPAQEGRGAADGEPGEGMDGWDGMGAIDMEKSGLN